MVKTYIGQKIIHLESVDSTNNYIANLLKTSETPSGAVILSDIQTEGRGQRANSWQSKPFENLTFSFLLKPSLVNDISSITINHCVSLALIEFIAAKGLQSKIKWPNDIYISNKKIAGILIENNFNSGTVTNSIIGVGININQVHFDALNATSLSLLTEKNYQVKGVLFEIIYHLNKQFEKYESTSANFIKVCYDQHLWSLKKSVTFSENGLTQQGTLLGSNEDGSIQILVNEDIRTFRNGEIVFTVSE